MTFPQLKLPLRTTLLYLLFGGLWILLSDQILSLFLFHDPQQAIFQTLKGWFFIFVSGIVLYVVLLSDFTGRQLAAEAIRASEERYRLIAQNSEDMIWTMNLNLQLTYVSPAVERALGYSAQEILASTPERFLTAESFSAGLNVLQQELENAQPQPDPSYARVLELEYRRKDMSTFWVEMKFSLFRDENKQPTGVLGVGRDITQRKGAEEALRESEERFSKAFYQSPIGIVLIDMADNTIQDVNDTILEMMRLPREQIIGQNDRQLGIQIDPAIYESIGKELSDRGMFRNKGMQIRLPNGELLHVLNSGALIFIQGKPYNLALLQDITQHKLAEEALRENEERLRLSLQAANQGLYDLNVQTGDAVVNREYAQMLGYDPETFVETNAAWIERLHPDDQESVSKAYTDYTNGLLSEYKVEFRQRMKDGNWKWILSLGKVIEYDREGKPLRMLGTHTDITERKQAEEEMQFRSRQLAVLLEASQSLTESLDRAEVLQEITDKAAEVLQVEKTAIYLIEGQELYLGASTPALPPDFPEALRRASLADHPHIVEALATRQSVILPDAASAILTPAEQTVRDALGLRTIFYVPLVARQVPVGILILGTVGEPRTFSGDERDVAHTLSNQAALAIANAKLYEDLSVYVKKLESQIGERNRAEEQIQRQLRYLSALRMIDIAISSSFDLNIILDVVLQQVVSRLEVDASAVLLFNTHLQTTEYAASRGFRSPVLRQTRLKLGEGYASQAVLKRQTIHVSALTEAGSKLALPLQTSQEEFVDYYGVPLVAKGEVKGVLEIYHRSYLKPDDEWLKFLEALAGQAAIAIDNAQLFENLQRSNFNLERRVVERTAELNHTNTELEHANRIKDEFLASMSHELRTPLTSILGLSESLLEQRGGSLNEHQEKSITMIESSGRHLLELINDILDLSKIEAGKFDYYPQPISVDDICRSSLAFVKTLAAKKSITVTYLQDSSISKMFADPRRLKQILVNLLSNAVKFTPQRGEVTLEVNADLGQDLIKFSVIDNGIGIAPHDLQRLFQPFVQVDSSLNRQHDGTGLGLALVQKLTDLHGGSVQVESEVGKGSRFTVNLPCLQEEVIKLEKFELQPASPFLERTPNTDSLINTRPHLGVVLLADDNMSSILTIGEYLESHGYEVVVAHDGSEALKKAESLFPDLILTDIQMPVMNGLEAIARLRGDIRFADTPIIALTALAMPGDRERSLLAGANEYMSKPVSLKRLVSTIKELLKQE